MSEDLLNKVKVLAVGVDDSAAEIYNDDSGMLGQAFVEGARAYRKLDAHQWETMQHRIAQARWDQYGFTDITKENLPDKWQSELDFASLALETMEFVKVR